MTSHRLGFWLAATTEVYAGGPPFLHVDYIVRFEHYATDYAVLARALGLHETTLPPKRNGSTRGDIGTLVVQQNDNEKKRRRRNWPKGVVVKYDPVLLDLLNVDDYRDIYTIKARQLVELHFARDLLLFNYAF
jgi:hypothetical protein